MTRALAVLVVFGCGSTEPRSPPPSEAAWAHIAELARPTVAPGPTEDLVAALAIVAANERAWQDVLDTNPAAPLNAFPNGSDAVVDLVTWSRAKGGLPPVSALSGDDPVRMHTLGSLAIRAGGDGVRAGTYLGERLIGEGGNLLEPLVGAWLLKRVRDQAAEEQHPTPPVARPDGELVRIVAAAAQYNKRQGEYLLTPEGHKEVEARMAALGSAAKASDFDRAHVAASERIWAAMLDGAQAGEAQKTTLDRVHRVASDDPRANKIVHAIDNVASALDELR